MTLSPEHELHAELFRRCPDLARELLATRDIILPDGIAELTTIDASQAQPIEARADIVVVVRDPDGVARCAVVVEVQTTEDTDKRHSWPLYVAALRARLRCPTTLLVLATSPAVARWARAPIELGHPHHALKPIVIGYDDIPRITSATAGPELAVLSARAHPELEVARAAFSAIEPLPPDTRRLYSKLFVQRLPEAVRLALESYMTPTLAKYLEDLLEKDAYDYGVRRGTAQGRAEGREVAMRSIALDVARLKLGPRFDASLASAIERQPVDALERLVHELVPADAAEADAIADRLLRSSND